MGALFIVVLVAYGTGLDQKLSPSSDRNLWHFDLARQPDAARTVRPQRRSFPILLRGPAAASRPAGPGADPCPAPRSKGHHPLPLGPGRGRTPPPGPTPALILADFHVGIDEAVEKAVPLLERTLEERDPPTRARYPDGLCHPLAGDSGRVDQRRGSVPS